MKKNGMLILTTVLLALFPDSVSAKWDNYTEGDGLADDIVWSICEDNRGNLWFGTINGVSRYDGVMWRTYTTDDGLAGRVSCTVYEDRSGNIWVGYRYDGYNPGAGGGVTCFDGTAWRTYTTEDGLAGRYVYAICEDRYGNLWFGTSGGVSRYDGVSWRTYTTEDGLAMNSVRTICEDRYGNLWFGMFDELSFFGGGVSRYDGSSWCTYTTEDGLADRCVYAICEDRYGNLWFGTSGGVSRYDGVSWRTYTTEDGLAMNSVPTICEDRYGNLWFGTSGGVSRYDGVSWRSYTEADGLVRDRVNAVLEDSSGNLWFGTTAGVSRYDGVSFRTFTAEDGLASDDEVHGICMDRSGNLWFSTYGGGVSKHDGRTWQTYTEADGLPSDETCEVCEDRSGNIWVGTTRSWVCRFDGENWRTFTYEDGVLTNEVCEIYTDSSGRVWLALWNGVNWYDGAQWHELTTEDGLVNNDVWYIYEDRDGSMWFGTVAGVSRYDWSEWTTFTTKDGLANNWVNAICEDRDGNLWFGSGVEYGGIGQGGLSRYDGVSWHKYTTEDGPASIHVLSISEDRSGNLWFGTRGGLIRYDGTEWGTVDVKDGLDHWAVWLVVQDHSGSLWFASYRRGGVQRYDPDNVPPQTVFTYAPAFLSPSPHQTATFCAGFREFEDITFSHSFDGSPWSAWSSTDLWQTTDLPDGQHSLAVRSRDKIGNIDATPAVCIFEIDATPPAPVIAFPAYGEAVRDSVAVMGEASDLRFEGYRVEQRPTGGEEWRLLAESASPVGDGVLCGWNTKSLSDGEYELRLSVSDTLGLTGVALVRVIVDNEAPWAYETTPVIVSAADGGNVYTTGRELHLYFPPHAFAGDTEVTVKALSKDDVPDTLAGGAWCVLPGFEIAWGGGLLEKPGTVEMSCPDSLLEPKHGTVAMYVFGADSTWSRLGGTVDPSALTISAPLTESGRYSVYVESRTPSGPGGLSDLSITPRVFSPSGGFASHDAAIGFTLGRPGPVTVKIYNRAGRLVSEVIAGERMTAGANLVSWDGRDGGGNVVEDGVYLVTVEALGTKQVKPLAVVR